jgi:NO-binding membrane sensor protein with MHYT domain/two-component sensor histidine kinase
VIQLPVWATLAGTYSATLVTASVTVAVLASYVALQLASRVIATTGRVRLAWLLGGAVAMGAGIWAMHFVGMLAFRLPDRPITYDPWHLTLSVVVAVAASGFALWVVSLGAGSWRPLTLGAVAMGGAIAGMHYLGMAGLHTAAVLTWRPELVAASVGIAILASGLGLGLAAWFQSDESSTTRLRRRLAAVVLGCAIAGMHYTAMAAARFRPVFPGIETAAEARAETPGVVATEGLAFLVVVATLIILGIALAGSVADRYLRTLAAEHRRVRASEAALAEAQRLSHTGSWTRSLLRPQEESWSVEWYRIFGLDPSSGPPSVQDMRDRLHPEDAQRVEELVRHAIDEKTDFDAEYRAVLPDGSIRHIHGVGHPVVGASGEVVEFVGTVMDVTEGKRAERAVRRTRDRVLQARFAAMIEERTRIAREIHDTLLQGFTGIALQLVAATSRVSHPPEAIAALRELIALAQKTLEDARQAVWDMREPALAGVDFPATLRSAVEDGLRGAGIVLDYTVQGVPRPLDPEVEAVVFRVGQEAIANVVKHAAAHTVRLGLSYGTRAVQLSVNDDGRGFAVDPDFHAYGGHWGLLGMRERANQIRAKLSIRSVPGHGSEIVIRVPYAIGGSHSSRSNPAGDPAQTTVSG